MTVRHDIAIHTEIDCKWDDDAKIVLGEGANKADPEVGDAYLYWDGSKVVFEPESDNTVFAWGDQTNNWDHQFFFANAGDYLYLDASASLIYTTDVDLQFKDNDCLVFGTGAGATGDIYVRWDGVNLDVLTTTDDNEIVFGDGTDNIDITFMAGASDKWMFDASALAWECHGECRLDLSAATLAAANTDGGVIKAGTSGARVTEDTASMKFVSLYFDDGATSGHAVGVYDRLYVTGAGGSGTALRAFTTVEDVAGATAHGAQISLNFGSTGSVTGLGVGVRGQVHIADQAYTGLGGTYAAMQPEIYSDGSSSDPTGMTELSFLRFCNDGDADGIADVDDDAFLMVLSGGSVGAGNIMAAKTAAAVSHTWRVKGPDGNTYYLMLSDAQ